MQSNEQTKPQYRVEPFGRDCLGNITGYRVVAGYGFYRTAAELFVGDIYELGSFSRARAAAESRCHALNTEQVAS